MKRILPFLLPLLLLAAPAAVKAQFVFTTNNGALTLAHYTGPGGDVAIPASTNGLPVASIGFQAFVLATNLTSVTIPDSVANIESNAFEECTSLTNVTITNGITNLDIGQQAFFGCGSLSSLTLPISVTNIGDYAFFECSNLASVTISNGSASLGIGAFDYCTSLTNLTLPNTVTNISSEFYGCGNLASITIAGGATSVEDLEFYDLTNLTSVTIPFGVTNIGNSAFAFCASLGSVLLPDSVTNIGASAFVLCTNLASVTIPDSVANIESNAFAECTSLGSVTIPDSVANIGSNAFAYCTSLTNLTISNGATFINIGAQAFVDCTSLASVAIPASVTNLGDAAFLECTSLASVTFSNPAASLGQGVFQDCTSLASATIPGSVTNAFDEFYGGANRIKVSLCAGSTNVAAKAFAYFTNLAGITLPDSVASIESNAFYECTGLAGVSIPASVTNIGAEAFLGCSNLASVVVGGSLAGIGYAGFVDCARLSSVTVLGSVTNIAEAAFQLCTNLNRLKIEGSVGSIGLQAFYGCSNLAGVAIYGGVGSIGQFAFLDCVNLTSVLLGGNAPNVSTNGPYVFYFDRKATVYHYEGTTGWSSSFAGLGDITLTKPSGLLYVFINGNGTATPNDNASVLTLGNSYTLTAAPASRDFMFVNWTGGTNTGDFAVLSATAKYKFQMASNLTLQANFVLTNYFFEAQGAYHGLFEDTSDLARQQNHSGSFTLNVTDRGSYTGDLYLGSATPLALSGKFSPNGTVTNTTKRSGKSTLTTTLTLDTNNQTVGGTVGDGSFVAQLSGNLAVFSSKNKAPYAGQYTVVIPGTTHSTNGPFGTSYGTVTVAASGVITFAGSLADGTTVSQTSAVSQDGAWPFYLPLYGGNGSIYSWNYFTNGVITLAANASWINATNPSAAAVYKAGFTNSAAVIYGSACTTNLLNLPAGMGQVVLEGGGLDLAPIITNAVSLASNDKITVTSNVNKMVLTINKANGLISGTFANDSKTVKVNGVLIQSETNAQGFFLGNDQTSGKFTLMAQ